MFVYERAGDYSVVVPDGARGPVVSVVWVRLIPSKEALGHEKTETQLEEGQVPLVGRVENGCSLDGMIVLKEEGVSFDGRANQMAIVGLTQVCNSYAFGKHANFIRIFPDSDSREPLVERFVVNADNAVTAQERLSELLERIINKSSFVPEKNARRNVPTQAVRRDQRHKDERPATNRREGIPRYRSYVDY